MSTPPILPSILPKDYKYSSGAATFVKVFKEDNTEAYVRYDCFVALLFKAEALDRMKLHAALGVCGEAGELADAIKKEVVYNKPVDRMNLVEELGDLRFYIQAVQNIYQISEQEVVQTNANKLAKRYKGLAYSDGAAISRADKAGEGKEST